MLPYDIMILVFPATACHTIHPISMNSLPSSHPASAAERLSPFTKNWYARLLLPDLLMEGQARFLQYRYSSTVSYSKPSTVPVLVRRSMSGEIEFLKIVAQ
ncbi:hypothetical protein HOY80DRAFT_963608 [Tuber brumale]|nr:hypothetical protein HOY80DRAFT_963608 [Tuber brumale]